MKKEDKIEDDYIIAYRRNIAIGEMWLEQYPLPEYNFNELYKFDFDPKSDYKYWGFTQASEDYSQDKYVFMRLSDKSKLILTKYSHIKLNI